MRDPTSSFSRVAAFAFLFASVLLSSRVFGAEALTELGGDKGDYRKLTLALVASERTKAGGRPGPGTSFIHPDFWRGSLESGLGPSFKKVVRAESVEGARGAGADLVAVVDCVAKIDPLSRNAEVELQASMRAADGSLLDTIYGRNDLALRDASQAVRWPQASADAEEDFKHSLLYSRRLADFAEAYRPPAAAPPVSSPPASVIQSDVDRPGYQRAARPYDFALVIGIEKYKALPDAEFAVRDAQAVRRHLAAWGVPERNILSLEGSDATLAGIQASVNERLRRSLRRKSTLFVYYAGYGVPDPQTAEAYLVPWDGDPQSLPSTAYPLSRFLRDLGRLRARHVLVVLDACFSGEGGRSVLAAGASPMVTKPDEGLHNLENVTFLAASAGSEIAGTLREQGHGLFTYFLLKGLGGAAAALDGSFTAKGLFDYLKPNVQSEASRQNRQQTPAFAGADFGL